MRSTAGDTGIRRLTTAAVLLVAGIAAVVSFLHIRELSLIYGQGALAAFLTPLSIDGAVVVASLAMLRAARFGIGTPRLARFMLLLAVAATLAANIGYGIPYGVPGALISGWPAVAFIGSVEIAVGMVRRISLRDSAAEHLPTGEHLAATGDEPSSDQPRVIGDSPAPVSAQSTPLPERHGGESAPAPALTPAPKQPSTPRKASTRQRARNGRPLARPIVERAVAEAGGIGHVNARALAKEHRLGYSTVRKHLGDIREESSAEVTAGAH